MPDVMSFAFLLLALVSTAVLVCAALAWRTWERWKEMSDDEF